MITPLLGLHLKQPQPQCNLSNKNSGNLQQLSFLDLLFRLNRSNGSSGST